MKTCGSCSPGSDLCVCSKLNHFAVLLPLFHRLGMLGGGTWAAQRKTRSMLWTWIRTTSRRTSAELRPTSRCCRAVDTVCHAHGTVGSFSLCVSFSKGTGDGETPVFVGGWKYNEGLVETKVGKDEKPTWYVQGTVESFFCHT